MRTKITLGIIVLFLVGALGIVVRDSAQRSGQQAAPFANGTSAGSESTNPSSGNTGTSGAQPSQSGKTYTMADVAKHYTQSSCWTAINGEVYDVTSWIGQHPGGAQAILSLCGIDGSTAFNDQHGGQRRPANELAGFLIGSLAG